MRDQNHKFQTMSNAILNQPKIAAVVPRQKGAWQKKFMKRPFLLSRALCLQSTSLWSAPGGLYIHGFDPPYGKLLRVHAAEEKRYGRFGFFLRRTDAAFNISNIAK